MDKQLIKDTLGWGFILWLVGYILGIVLFAFVSPSILGWVIMPIGIIITLWVLFNKIKSEPFKNYIIIAITWTLVAIIFDYLFLVLIFKPIGGYYKLDVYVYYTFTFVLPLIVGLIKKFNINNIFKLVIPLMSVVIILVIFFAVNQLFILQKAHSTFENYYAFRGCIQLVEKTDTYGTCKTSSGQTIKIVEIQDKWYLDGDGPGIW
jgi:hypothetical protein